MKLSDRIISAAIRYQTACSIMQQHAGYSFDKDMACKKAFSDLVSLAEQADVTRNSDNIQNDITRTGDNTIHTLGEGEEPGSI